MKKFVSDQWIRVLALTVSMSVVGAIFIPYGFPWAGLVWASFALAAALWTGFAAPPTMAQTLGEIDAEPLPVFAGRHVQGRPVRGAHD
jgi:hypothetical protein